MCNITVKRKPRWQNMHKRAPTAKQPNPNRNPHLLGRLGQQLAPHVLAEALLLLSRCRKRTFPGLPLKALLPNWKRTWHVVWACERNSAGVASELHPSATSDQQSRHKKTAPIECEETNTYPLLPLPAFLLFTLAPRPLFCCAPPLLPLPVPTTGHSLVACPPNQEMLLQAVYRRGKTPTNLN